jgi:hypothetical protein
MKNASLRGEKEVPKQGAPQVTLNTFELQEFSQANCWEINACGPIWVENRQEDPSMSFAPPTKR